MESITFGQSSAVDVGSKMLEKIFSFKLFSRSPNLADLESLTILTEDPSSCGLIPDMIGITDEEPSLSRLDPLLRRDDSLNVTFKSLIVVDEGNDCCCCLICLIFHFTSTFLFF